MRWMRRPRPAPVEPAAPADPYLDALAGAQFERRRALIRGDVLDARLWTDEVDVLVAMGRSGFAVLRASTEPTEFMAEATEEVEADAEADNVLTIEFDDDGLPWCWAPDGWTDDRILGVLRKCVSDYEDTSEDHL